MRARSRVSCAALLVAVLASCRELAVTPVVRTAAGLAIVSTPPDTVAVGSSAGVLSVKVTDAAGSPLSGVVVAFSISRGSGTLMPTTDTSRADGIASTSFRLGTLPGPNDVTAVVRGVTSVKFTVTGVAGSPRSVTLAPRAIRYLATQDSALSTATPRDTFNNATGTPVTWLARDPTLVSVTPALTSSAVVRVLRRPGATFLVATSGSAADSTAVIVNDTTSTPCSFVATPSTLAIGATIQFDSGVACVRSTVAGAEYAVVAHLNTAAYSVSQSIEVVGDGVTTPLSTFPLVALEAPRRGGEPPSALRDLAFEHAMRERERREIGPRVAGARAWFGARARVAPTPVDAVAHALPSVAQKGDQVSLNVNAFDFCSKPDLRQGRIVAVTDGAIVMADADNPAGGFADEEYRAFGVAMDTLVNPVDTAAFGAPTDIDGNGRVGVFFTRAVNELTPQGSAGGIVLGYYYIRDLLPRQSPFGACPGSNVGEMFYILVPDPGGTVNGNARTKAFVASTVVGTIAHEYQHLINAARRMYVTNALRVDEEVWLNEGLSHIAEELVFFRAGGSAPRLNITGGQLALGTTMRTAFDTYQRGNVARYKEYLSLPESNSPLAGDDKFATRGATWSFLRYLVDRVRPSDGDFWRRLVDSRATGTINVDSALAGTGVTTVAALRDWSVSVLADDNPPNTSPALQQQSWNFISAMPALGGGLSFTLVPRVLTNGLSSAVGLIGGGSSYLRFAVAQNQEALIRVNGFGGTPLPAGIRLTIVRIK